MEIHQNMMQHYRLSDSDLEITMKSFILETVCAKHYNLGHLRIKTFTGPGEGINFHDKRYSYIDHVINESENKCCIFDQKIDLIKLWIRH